MKNKPRQQNLEQKTEKNNLENAYRGPLGWAKFGVGVLIVSAGAFTGCLKFYHKYNAQRLEYQAKIPAEYTQVEKQRIQFNSLNELKLIDKLRDPNFVKDSRYAISKYHEYLNDPEVSKNLKMIEKLGNKEIGWQMGVLMSGWAALVGSSYIVGAGIYSLNKKIKKYFNKK